MIYYLSIHPNQTTGQTVSLEIPIMPYSLPSLVTVISLFILITSRPLIAQSGCENWNTPEFFTDTTAQIVQRCLETGADPNARYTFPRSFISRTPLHWTASFSGTPEVVQLLLSAGAEMDARDEYGRTPLHEAAHRAAPDTVQAFLNAGADRNVRNHYGYTPLRWAAAYSKQPEVVHMLLNAQTGSNDDVNTLLHDAAAHNRTPEVIRTLLNAGANLNARDKYEATPLHSAAKHGMAPEIVQFLLDAGAQLDPRNRHDRTPLHEAARYSLMPEIVQLLLDTGSNPNALDVNGNTPFDLIPANSPLRGTVVYRQLDEMRLR